MSMNVVEFDSVRKEYSNGVVALDSLNLTIPKGEVFGFLGPNGAGKSTTINLLLGFTEPTTGTVTVFGKSPQTECKAIKRNTGVLPEGFDLYSRLTGRDHVKFAISSKEADNDPDELLKRVGLRSDADRKAGGYSKGMRQRLGLAMALAGDPDLLILDEPTSGLDPGGAREIRNIIRQETERGTTVFFSSHILEQIEQVCDRIGILYEGTLITVDTIEGLRSKSGTDRLAVTVDGNGEELAERARTIPEVSTVAAEENTLLIECDRDDRTSVLDSLREMNVPITEFSTEETSLEELFISYTEGEKEVPA